MSGFQNFRKSLNGFNREDVVRYIEYMNNKHNSQIEQLNTQLQTAQAELAKRGSVQNDELNEQLQAAQARCAELEALLAGKADASETRTEDELEVYRRAERTERLARERASQVYAQANAVLADASLKADAASALVSEISEKTVAQMQAYQASINDAKDALQEAVSALYAIRSEE